MHSMTLRPPSSAAFVLLAMNYIQVRSCQRRFYAQFNQIPLQGSIFLFIPLLFSAKRARFPYIIRLVKNDSPLAMPAQRPPNLTVFQLLCANLSCKRSIGLVKHILAADFDFLLEVFPDEE